jgi:hypothetical protein
VGKPLELGWVLRPDLSAPGAAAVAAHAGKRVHAVGTAAGVDGLVEVVLVDGERVRVHRGDVVPE